MLLMLHCNMQVLAVSLYVLIIINMRIVTLEEHISLPELTSLLPAEALASFGQSPAMQQIIPKLANITDERLKSMDDNVYRCRLFRLTALAPAF